MHKLFTFLESDENYARFLKWNGVVIGVTVESPCWACS